MKMILKVRFRDFLLGSIVTLAAVCLLPSFMSCYSGLGFLKAKFGASAARGSRLAFVTIMPDYPSNQTLQRFDNLVGSLHKNAKGARLFVFSNRPGFAQIADAMEKVTFGGQVPWTLADDLYPSWAVDATFAQLAIVDYAPAYSVLYMDLTVELRADIFGDRNVFETLRNGSALYVQNLATKSESCPVVPHSLSIFNSNLCCYLSSRMFGQSSGLFARFASAFGAEIIAAIQVSRRRSGMQRS
jgi:hypothetical protein